MKEKVIATALVSGLMFCGAEQARALSPETEMLLELLQAKGVLTASDAKNFSAALEERLAAQPGEEAQAGPDQQGVPERIEKLEDKAGAGLGSLADRVELSGLVEVAASAGDDFNDEDSSDVTLATVEIGLDATLSEWARAHLLLLYEEGEEDNHVTIDEGFITLGNSEKVPVSLSAGKMYLPFGFYETNMISDPLPLEIGETGDSAVRVDFAACGLYGTVYAFNGDVNETGEDDQIDGYGAAIGYLRETETMKLDVGAGWLNNIADSDGIGDHLADEVGIDEVNDYVDGLSLYASLNAGPFTLIGEYVTALDDFRFAEVEFDGKGARPAAYAVECAYTTDLFGRETTFAAGYQATDEAVALELPEQRYIAAVTMAIFNNTTLALEYLHDEDYGTSEDGTGNDADVTTLQLAVEF